MQAFEMSSSRRVIRNVRLIEISSHRQGCSIAE
jgi:hypothetical protein